MSLKKKNLSEVLGMKFPSREKSEEAEMARESSGLQFQVEASESKVFKEKYLRSFFERFGKMKLFRFDERTLGGEVLFADPKINQKCLEFLGKQRFLKASPRKIDW